MKILVTGGAGYKGVRLVEALLARGYDVTLMDNFMYGFEPVMHLAAHPGLTVMNRDVRVEDDAHLSKYDVVFHLAGISGFPACEANPNSAERINVDATQRIASALSPQQLMIYASTSYFYGAAEGADCDEDTVVNPVSAYGITKYQGERRMLQRERSIALRFGTVFGISPKMRVDLIVNDFVYRAVTERVLVLFDSVSRRTVVHIDDVIAGYLFAMDNAERMSGGVYNVGDGSLNYTKMEVAQAIHKVRDFEIVDSSLADHDVRNFNISFEKIRRLGYTATRTLEEGIDELLRLYSFYRYHSHTRPI